MRKNSLFILIVLTGILTLTGCSKDNVQGDSKNNNETYTNSEVNISDGEDLNPKDVIFDLVSVVDSVRKAEEVEKYKAYNLLIPIVEEGESGETGEAATDNDKKKFIQAKTKYTNPDRIKKFLEDTETVSGDYKDLYIAHYPEDNYTVGIAVPTDGNEDVANKFISYREKLLSEASVEMKSYYEKSIVTSTNGCVVISISETPDTYMLDMVSYIESVYELLNSSFKSGENTGENVNEEDSIDEVNSGITGESE